MNQEIFDLIFNAIKKLGYDVYPYLPKTEVNYPFVVMGEVQTIPKMTKSFSLGEVSLFIHVFTEEKSRKQCFDILEDIRNTCSKFNKPHTWFLKSGDTRILSDDSTNDILWHGILTCNYEFY